MERFEVKRGVIKSMGGNAGLAKLATQHFNDVEVMQMVYSPLHSQFLAALQQNTPMMENYRSMSSK